MPPRQKTLATGPWARYGGPCTWPPGSIALSYARQSDDIQTSIPDQHAMNERAAAELGLTIPPDARYSEIMSRSKDDRPEFDRMMQRLAEPEVVVLIAWMPSRLFGSMEQQMVGYRMLTRHSIRLFDKDGHEDDVASHEGRFIGALKGWLSEAEVIQLRKRVADTHRVKAEKGRILTRPALGLKVVEAQSLPCQGQCRAGADGSLRPDADCPVRHSEISKKHTTYVIDEPGRAVLLQIFQWAAEGRLASEIETLLGQQGYRSPARLIKRGPNAGKIAEGTRLTKNNIRRLILNPLYKGYARWNLTQVKRDGPDVWRESQDEQTWILAPHALGPIVPVELWEEANRHLAANYRSREDRAVNEQRLFDGILFCGRCGWKLALKQRGGKAKPGTFDYYCQGAYNSYSSCSRRAPRGNGEGSRGQAIPESWLIPLLTGDLTSLSPATRKAVGQLDLTFDDTGAGAVESEMAALRIRLNEAWQSLDRIEDLLMDGAIRKERGQARRVELTDAIAEMGARLEQLQTREIDEAMTGRPEDLADLGELLADPLIPLEERRTTLLRLIDRAVLDRPRLTFYCRPQSA